MEVLYSTSMPAFSRPSRIVCQEGAKVMPPSRKDAAAMNTPYTTENTGVALEASGPV